MNQVLGLKLIVVANNTSMILYEAEKNKIVNKIYETKLHLDRHHYHTENKGQLERAEASKEINKHLEHLLSNNPSKYKELVLVAESQMLGKIREALSNNLKQLISKELAKDLVNHDMHSIESILFVE